MKCERKIALVPKEGKWFKINPLSIEQKLFEDKREDEKQEKTRKIILEAFEEMSKYPEKYARSFKTMMPKKTWNFKTVAQLKEMASTLGDHNADWVEQALEWAQRIQNGESWKIICNDKDKANHYRLVIWKNGYARFIGGSINYNDHIPASDISHDDIGDNTDMRNTVPLVVSYK